MAKQELVKAPEQQLAKLAPGALAERPLRLKPGDKRGMETFTKDDISIPRLALAQALSPQVTEGDPAYVAGMTAGDLFNSMTSENYGREVFVQILRKDKLRAVEFFPIEDGGGIRDLNVPLSDDRCKWGEDGEKPRATIFRDYIGRLILPDGRREMIALSFKSTGIKVAKQLNGLIAVRNASIFEGVYRITTDTELVPKPHKIYVVENAGWATDEDSATGAELWEAMKDIDVASQIDRDAHDDFPTVPHEPGAGPAEDM
ncbi:MAG TPA: hypothetical protein VM531_11355 [Sphingomicrobium sp.]|jgi:hypothetical protein|nr:hypothetical protein [Sphingomicrobium sp.]